MKMDVSDCNRPSRRRYVSVIQIWGNVEQIKKKEKSKKGE